MDDEKPTAWRRIQNLSINKKALSRRMRRAEGVTLRHARKFIFKRWSNAREVQRHIILWVVAVGVLIGATGLQLAWYQQNYRTSAVADGGTYAEAVLGPVDTLNPIFASTSAEESAGQLLFSRLFNYDRTGHLSGDLATSMTTNSAGTEYTVKLRSDAVWHDGIHLTAKDVVFTVGLIKNPAVHATITGWSDITAVATDDNTVVFTLPAVYAAFPHALTTLPILPEHLLAKIEPNSLRENEFSRSPIGSGPFKLRFVQDVDLNAGRKIVHLERGNYYKGKARIERLQLHVYNSRDVIVHALDTGEVSAAADLSATSVKQVNADRYKITTEPISSGVYALFNTTKDILKDKQVRLALQRGTDTLAIREQLPVSAPALDLPLLRRQLSGDIPKIAPYNRDEARQMLDAAGWKLEGNTRKKAGTELSLTVVTTKDSDYERVLETLAGQWRELGVAVVTQVVDPTDVSQRVTQDILQPRNFDVLLYQLTIGSDPDVFAYWHSSQAFPNNRGYNFSNYASAISDDALSSARSRTEPSLRNAKYLTFIKQWIADAPAIGLYQSTVHYVASKGVGAYDTTNTFVSSIDRYADVLYWSVDTQTVFTTP